MKSRVNRLCSNEGEMILLASLSFAMFLMYIFCHFGSKNLHIFIVSCSVTLKFVLFCLQETYQNILNCDYNLEEPEFETISDEAKDFISRLIVRDQGKRMSADESLNHAWLQEGSNRPTIGQVSH